MFYLQFPDIYDAKIQTFTETTSQLQKKITRMLFLGILFFFKVPPLSWRGVGGEAGLPPLGEVWRGLCGVYVKSV